MSVIERPLRSIRSFVRRQGRLTARQQRALECHGATYQIDLTMLADILAIEKPKCLEIGFGMGHSLVQLAAKKPDWHFIGAEVHPPGLGHCIDTAHQAGVKNLHVFPGDVNELLSSMPDHSLNKVLCLFPDPWPKKRHHKRRLIQPDFVSMVAQKLVPGGIFHLATDWWEYAEHMLSVLESNPLLENVYGQNQFAPSDVRDYQTKFEKRGERLKHGIWDLVYQRYT